MISLSHFEESLIEKYGSVVGVDEVGVSAIAGPLVAAALRVDPNDDLPPVDDSKALKREERETIFEDLLSFDFSVGIVSVEELTNLRKGSVLAMSRAASTIPSDVIIVDYYKLPLGVPTIPMTRADEVVYCVAAASIVAKVFRDYIMRSLHFLFPEYHWDSNVGYPSRAHYSAMFAFGKLVGFHRENFRLVRRAPQGESFRIRFKHSLTREEVLKALDDPRLAISEVSND